MGQNYTKIYRNHMQKYEKLLNLYCIKDLNIKIIYGLRKFQVKSLKIHYV
jgi:hypothetical protein